MFQKSSFDLLKRCQRFQGLSYVEVMVSMITSAIFLSTTLQAYVAATGIRARSQQINTAIANIQADTESIRQMAQTLPQTAADCQVSSSSSYAQQLIASVIAKDTAANQTQSTKPIVSAIEQREGQSILEQSTTLPISGLPDDYMLRRILWVDKSVATSAQVLEISYQVLRDATRSPQEEDADRSQSLQIQSEIPLAQLHTSVIPNASLVCF
jgi:Tfp pilus assembly protein PilE